ncbi:MAG TPA: EscU/YscU/HrcU family type III secretion system export apparatus switch protein [Pseudogracilibacillus sp.]|nr:EscU/YscU/HrcU family type III secretion system export apparatus switch protein [Pseudogracilibacillus sp.]
MKENRKKAAALSYDQATDSSPRLTAHGKGLVADQIIETAKKNNIPVLVDESLVELLANLNIDEAIPSELYEAVAEVFAFVYQLDQQVDESYEK